MMIRRKIPQGPPIPKEERSRCWWEGLHKSAVEGLYLDGKSRKTSSDKLRVKGAHLKVARREGEIPTAFSLFRRKRGGILRDHITMRTDRGGADGKKGENEISKQGLTGRGCSKLTDLGDQGEGRHRSVLLEGRDHLMREGKRAL